MRVRPDGAFDVTPPSVSYHLKILREAGLISSDRRGTWIYYRVNPDVMARMSAVLAPAPVSWPGDSGLRRSMSGSLRRASRRS